MYILSCVSTQQKEAKKKNDIRLDVNERTHQKEEAKKEK